MDWRHLEKMKILTNGCSFTQGIYDNHDEKDTWAYMLGHDVVNLAEGGGSNHRIFRTTMSYLLDNEVDLIIIGWTGPERIEIPYYKNDWLRVSHGFVLPENDDYAKDRFNQNQYWYRNCHNDVKSMEQFIFFIRTIQAMPVRCIMFNALQCDFLWQIEKEDAIAEHFDMLHLTEQVDKIDKSDWVLWGSSMEEYLVGFPSADEYGHPTKEGHEFFAKKIVQFI